MLTGPLTVRPAEPADVPAVVQMVRELADFERSLAEARLTEEALLSALFGPRAAAHAHVAVLAEGAAPDAAQEHTVGFALWFLNFSTWLGVHGIYLEDLYVRPEHRGTGAGRALLQTLARLAVDEGYGRAEWSVLDWNVDAHGFYRRLGAAPMDEWTVWRLSGDALRHLAGCG